MPSRILSISVMAGAIIGAGIFSLPYVFTQIGILNGLIFMAVITGAVVLIHLFYADLVLKTKGQHNFVGFARIYLGKAAAALAVVMTVVEMLLVLVIYLILSQSFASLIINGASLTNLLLFWGLGTAAVFLTLRRVALLEFLITGGMVAIIIILVFLSISSDLSQTSFSSGSLTASNFFFPIGPILFALAGRVAVVEAVRASRRSGALKNIKQSIALGTIIPAVVYVLFVLAIVALSPAVSKDAVSGLVGYLPPFFLLLIGVLGWLSLWSSYIIIGFDVNDILKTDLRWPLVLRAATVALVPIGIYLAGFQDFIQLVGLVGGVFLVLEAVFIILMRIRLWRSSS